MKPQMLSGLASLIRLQWRTSWPMLLGLPAFMAGIVVATGAGIREMYPTLQERVLYEASMGESPVSLAFNGRGYELQTFGGITAYEVGFMGQMAVPIIGVVIAVNLTRRLEETGILELITASRVHRVAVPLAAAISCLIAWTLFAVLGAAGMYLDDYDLWEAVKYLVIMALFGMAYSGIGLFVGQIASTARSATGLGLGVVLGLLLARAVIDGRDLDLTWATPPGWVAEAHPWGTWVWWPVWAFTVMILVGVVTAVAVCGYRDLGSGVLAQRLGRAHARARLGTPFGLIWRLCSGAVLSWLAGATVWAAGIAAMTQSFIDVVAQNPTLTAIFGEDVEKVTGVIALLLMSVMAISTGLMVINRMGAEESAARLGLLVAGRVPRWRWWLAWSVFALVSSAAVLIYSVVVFGVTQWQILDRWEFVRQAITAGADYLAPVSMLVAFGVLVTTVAPGWRGLSWIFPVGVFVIGVLADALRLPDWARNLSPLELVGQVPAADPDRQAEVVMVVIGVAALVVAWQVMIRRDLHRG